MAANRKLKVDVTDPKDLRAKVTEAEKIWEEKLRVVRAAEEDADYWKDLVANLKQLAGIVTFDESVAGSRPSPAQDAVVRIVEREGRAMRPMEVTALLREEGNDVRSNAAVNAALYAAAEAGRLRRPKQREYAPLRSKMKVKKPLKKAVKKKVSS